MAILARSPRSTQPRPQSDTRLDVLDMMMAGTGGKRHAPRSPRDSLSPCDEYFDCGAKDSSRAYENGHMVTITVTPPDPEPIGKLRTGTCQAQPESQQQRSSYLPRTSSLQSRSSPTPAARLPTSCSPRSRLSRSRCPSTLYVDSSYGLTTLAPHELRHSIRRTASSEPRRQVLDYNPLPSPPPAPRRRLGDAPPPLPPKSLARKASAPSAMGNLQSHSAGGDRNAAEEINDRSLCSVVRSPKGKIMRMSRRSSMGNVFKRMDSKSPLPSDFSATVFEVPRATTAPDLDGISGDDAEKEPTDDENEYSSRRNPAGPSPLMPGQPVSPATMTEESAARPFSTADTLTGHDSTQFEEEDTEALRVSALSPSLPTPSPLPEDSPHKYGLKDRMDTPEVPSPPANANSVKARRLSSGIEIFNEARDLQSASSFLNGLSTARRRAESRTGAQTAQSSRNLNEYRQATRTTPSPPYPSAHKSLSHLPLATKRSKPLLKPTSASTSNLSLLAQESNPDLLARNLGHTTKASGFAYARPLNITQLKCFRGHNRLLLSRNKDAPVECAVCHVDDEQNHFSCSWCALRMCGACRRDFASRGMRALKERVRMAELGGCAQSDLEQESGRRSYSGIESEPSGLQGRASRSTFRVPA